MAARKGLAASAKRDDRDNAQGVVTLIVEPTRASIIKLKCETDFVASSDGFKAEADALAKAILEKGEAGVGDRATQIDDLKITLKEKIEVGETIRFEAAAGNILDSYTHVQGGRGVNGVIVEMSGASVELAHDIAVHIAFARPRFLQREDIPADVLEKERETLEAITRNEGKPEQAIAKIVEGRIGGLLSKTFVFLSSHMPRTTKSVFRNSLVQQRLFDSHRWKSANDFSAHLVSCCAQTFG